MTKHGADKQSVHVRVAINYVSPQCFFVLFHCERSCERRGHIQFWTSFNATVHWAIIIALCVCVCVWLCANATSGRKSWMLLCAVPYLAFALRCFTATEFARTADTAHTERERNVCKCVAPSAYRHISALQEKLTAARACCVFAERAKSGKRDALGVYTLGRGQSHCACSSANDGFVREWRKNDVGAVD